jgi:hypothetical protein
VRRGDVALRTLYRVRMLRDTHYAGRRDVWHHESLDTRLAQDHLRHGALVGDGVVMGRVYTCTSAVCACCDNDPSCARVCVCGDARTVSQGEDVAADSHRGVRVHRCAARSRTQRTAVVFVLVTVSRVKQRFVKQLAQKRWPKVCLIYSF